VSDEIKELEERLAKARADRAAVDAKRGERSKLEELRKKVADEERAARDEAAIAAMEEKHGPLGEKIRAVYTACGVVIVKRPHHVLFKRYQDSKGKAADVQQLIYPCIVHPTTDELDKIIEEQPAELIAIGNAVCTLAGVRNEEVSGKS
jgi:hypothetical protein